MPRSSYDDLLRTLGRGELVPVYYLFGSEDVLKDEASRSIVDRTLEPHERDFNLDQRSAQGLEPEELHALVNTLPMMASRRVVIIRDIETWRKKKEPREVLQKYLANPSDDTVLVLLEGAPNEEKQKDWSPDEAIVARSCAVDFAPLPPDRVVRWLGYHSKRLGISFAEGAVEHLAAATGYDLGALRAEIEKFASLTDQGPITRDQVGDIVGVRHGETLEDWVEGVLGDDVPRALALGRRVIEQAGMSGVKMVTALGTALVGLRLARAHYDRGSRGAALERVLLDRLRQVRPFGLGDWKTTTRNWSRWTEAWPAARLRTAVRATLDADMALKGTRVTDEAGLLTDLVLRLGARGTHRRIGGKAGGATARWRRSVAATVVSDNRE
jgi:DNA polymerase-3 subunit delta